MLNRHFHNFLADYESRFEEKDSGRGGRVSTGNFAPRCPPPPGRLHRPWDAAGLLQGQAPASGGTLPLGSPLIGPLVHDGQRKPVDARHHCCHSDIWRPDQLPPLSPFPGDRGRGVGGGREAGTFPMVSRFDDTGLAELFACEVLRFLVDRELFSPEWAERILSWRRTGFSVHSLIRARTKSDAARIAKSTSSGLLGQRSRKAKSYSLLQLLDRAFVLGLLFEFF